MERFIIAIICIVLLCNGCAPTTFKPPALSDLKLAKTEPYKLDLSSIKVPDSPPEKIFAKVVNGKIVQTTEEQATHVMFAANDFGKITAMMKAGATYKAVALNEETLINIHIDTINALKEYLELERNKAQMYREMYAESENFFRQERYQHNIDNFMNRLGMGLLVLGTAGLSMVLLH